jgi:CxxC motif-containing protein
MNKEMTCIVCPNGCTLKLDYEIREGKPVLAKVTGNLCPQGLEYARQELLAPKRTIASSVLVEGGELPLVSVRTRGAIPKEKISDVMEEIRKCRVKAPVAAGTVLLSNVLGLGADVIATKTVEKE